MGYLENLVGYCYLLRNFVCDGSDTEEATTRLTNLAVVSQYAEESPHQASSGIYAWLNRVYGPFPFRDGFPEFHTLPKILWTEFKLNWRSGVSVALVSLPLSISLAVASGATPSQGLVSAAWGGLVHSSLAGSSFNILGPTGALSGVLSANAVRYGPEILPFLAVLSALLLTVVFLLRIDQFLMYIPESVIQGFTVGVAFIIFINQIAGGMALHIKSAGTFNGNMKNIFSHLDETNIIAVIVWWGTIFLLFGLSYKYPKVPWVVMVAFVGILFGWLIQTGNIPMSEEYRLQTLIDKFPNTTSDFFTVAQFKTIWFTHFSDFLVAAFNIMFVTILETLISAKIAEGLTHTKYIGTWEVVACTCANYVSGFFSGIPVTAALARTAYNIKNGATSRMSGIINAFVIFFIGIALLRVFVYLLIPVVAGIVSVVAFKMVEYHHIVLMWKYDKPSLVIFGATAVISIVVNPTAGVIIGALLSFFRTARNVASIKQESTVILDGHSLYVPVDPLLEVEVQAKVNDLNLTYRQGDVLVFVISGDLTYLNAESYVEKAQNIHNSYKKVILSLHDLGYLDFSGHLALTQICDILERKVAQNEYAYTEEDEVLLGEVEFGHDAESGRIVDKSWKPVEIIICGITEKHRYLKSLLLSQPWFKDKFDKGLMFDTYQHAIEYFQKKSTATIPRMNSTRFLVSSQKLASYGSTDASLAQKDDSFLSETLEFGDQPHKF